MEGRVQCRVVERVNCEAQERWIVRPKGFANSYGVSSESLRIS